MKEVYVGNRKIPSYEEWYAKNHVNVLGTVYTIQEQTAEENEHLKDADGYCDRTAKEIVIVDLSREKCTIKNPEWYRRKLLRHEIIHAFLFESGLGECANWNDSTIHNEQMVDWIAIQFPKMLKAFEEAGCI